MGGVLHTKEENWDLQSLCVDKAICLVVSLSWHEFCQAHTHLGVHAGRIMSVRYRREGEQHSYFYLASYVLTITSKQCLPCKWNECKCLTCHCIVLQLFQWISPCIFSTMQLWGCASGLLGPSSLSWAALYIACALVCNFCIHRELKQ